MSRPAPHRANDQDPAIVNVVTQGGVMKITRSPPDRRQQEGRNVFQLTPDPGSPGHHGDARMADQRVFDGPDQAGLAQHIEPRPFRRLYPFWPLLAGSLLW